MQKPTGKQFLILNLVNNIQWLLSCPLPPRFPALFRLDPQSFAGRIIGTLLLAAIFVLIIGLLLNVYNVRQFPAFIFAFLDTFVPLWLICSAVALITNPAADKLAFQSRS